MCSNSSTGSLKFQICYSNDMIIGRLGIIIDKLGIRSATEKPLRGSELVYIYIYVPRNNHEVIAVDGCSLEEN